MTYIEFEEINNYAVIKLNRPEKYNSFIKPMALELQEVLDVCHKKDSIRAVYLTANGKAFCAGQDLKEATNEVEKIELVTIVREHYNPIIKKIRKLPKPIVCGVNGVAAGAGANIALSCDITIAADSASFIQAFSKIGLIPDSGGTYFLPRLIGMQKAAALFFTGDAVSAKEATQMGMIFKSVTDETLHTFSTELTKKLANMPTKSIGYTKRLMNKSFENDLNTQLKKEAKYQELSGETLDFKEGVLSFLEKRKPRFNGQ